MSILSGSPDHVVATSVEELFRVQRKNSADADVLYGNGGRLKEQFRDDAVRLAAAVRKGNEAGAHQRAFSQQKRKPESRG